MSKLQPLVNIVVRTFNEEDWIRSCLTTIFAQDYQNIVVTVVDSGSTDATISIVKEFPSVSVVEIENFLPGKAINIGIEAQPSRYAMILSAHCLIKNVDCISNYVSYLERNPNVAGAYGRQLPLKHTHHDDARDLILTFGSELRLQKKDSFFHNANSMLRVSVVDEIPIDNTVKHIEDRLWADHVIQAGYHIAYLPDAEVYHYHGLHQHGKNASFRAEGVASLLRQFGDEIDEQCEKIHRREFLCPIVILVSPEISAVKATYARVQEVLKELPEKHVYVFSNNPKYKHLCEENNSKYLERAELGVTAEDSFRVLSRKLLHAIEADLGMISDSLNFVDMSYSHLNLGFVRLSRTLLFERFYKAVLPAWRDSGNYWKRDGSDFVELNVNYEKQSVKSELYRSVLGQGGCVRSSEIRSPKESWSVDELISTNDIDIVKRVRFD